MKFEQIDPADADWSQLDGYGDRVVSQRRGWLEFIADTQRGDVTVARLMDDGEAVGYLSGIRTLRFGLRVFGSPLDGWSTPFMGFNLKPGVDPRAALRAAEVFAFRQLGCLHMELRDRRLAVDDGAALRFDHRLRHTFISDLARDEDALFALMTPACRRNVRAARRNGLIVEQAEPAGFAETYYDQLLDVFAKQGLKPTYGVDRVRALIDHLHPTGSLLLLRVKRPDGAIVATGLYPGFRAWCFFWGSASYRADQRLRPNEILHWEAMRYWKARGAVCFDWGGGGDYKKKFGVTPVTNPHFFKSAHPFMQTVRSQVYALIRGLRNTRSRLARRA